MPQLLSLRALSFSICLLTACGSSVDPAPSTGSPADSGTTETGTGTGPVTAGPTKYKTHVILGDSISDTGGEAPFYYALLDQNDDAKYPDAMGLDLKTTYGADLNIVKASRNGAKSVNMLSQIASLPTSLPGPVLVTITIGGNDVQAAIGTIITGGDDTPQRNDFAKYLGEGLAELNKPGRFGEGVQVKVLLANIYDPSDGTGKFVHASTGKKCPGALAYYPADKPTAPLLDPWEQVMTDAVAKYPNSTSLLDLRAKFQGHGVGSADPWFVTDCIHPNAKGHDALRDMFWETAIKQ